MEQDPKIIIASNIKKYLEKHNMSQKFLAEKIGVKPSTLSDYLNHRSKPSHGVIQKIANTFGVYKSDIDTTFKEDSESYITSVPKTRAFPDFANVPILGTICAGDGLLADQNIEDYVSYPFPYKRQPDFALRVKGDSMKEVSIDDGDIVYLRTAPWAEYNGQIVVALINDQEEGMLKRMKWSEDSNLIQLIPENDEYNTIEVMPNEVTVCGVYMGHFKPDKEE